MVSQNKPRLWIAAVYLVLLGLAIPWYWPPGDARHAFGFPLWALAMLLVLGVTSAFTAWVYLSGPPDEPDG